MKDLTPVTVNTGFLVARALNHPIRQALIKYIEKHPGTTVSDIYTNRYQKYNILRTEQSIISLHLSKLRRAGMLRSETDGRTRRYYTVPENYYTAALSLMDMAACYQD